MYKDYRMEAVIMDKYLNEKTSGKFTINGETYFGEMKLNGSESTLKVYLNDFVPLATEVDYPTQVHGTLYDLTKVTLIDMLFLGGGGANRQTSNDSWERSQYLEFDLHYVIFGDEFIYEDTSKFSSVNFTLPDAHTLFRFETFEWVTQPSQEEVLKLIDENRRGVNKYKFGDMPEIFIYTGAYELEEILIPYGKFKLRNNVNITFPSNRGFSMQNTIISGIEFSQPNSFWEALKKANSIVKISELIIGRKQTINAYKLEMEGQDSLSNAYDIYQMKVDRKTYDSSTHSSDRLINIENEMDELKDLLSNWILRQDEWNPARKNFFEVFADTIYGSDTLIKVANLYDIIPDSAYQRVEPVSEEVLEAKKVCKDIFKDLPVSLERDSILGALGRIGTKSLKHKIRDRYLIVENSGLVELEDITLVIGQAVDCRNFYVHGGTPKFDYVENFNEVCFFIDTLLFIYGVSEIIELGWSHTNWKPDSFNRHPFSQYLINYKHNLLSLNEALNT